ITRTLTLKGIYEHILSQNGQTNAKKNAKKFGKDYCIITRHLLRSIIEKYKHNEEHTLEILEGLCNLVPTMNDYFDHISVFERDIEESEMTFILYESFTLPNEEQVRATNHYHNMPVFSNIAVYMDSEQKEFNGYCFAK
ncbi:519_t:CDS:1, partial [Gigaspora rosea]